MDAAAASAAATACASAAANAAIAATSSSGPPAARGICRGGRTGPPPAGSAEDAPPAGSARGAPRDAEEHQLQTRENAAAGEEPPKVQRGAHASGEVEASSVHRVATALRERRLRRVRSAGPHARQFTLRPRRGGYPRAVPEYPARGGEQPVLKRSPRRRGDEADEADAGETARDCARGDARGGGRGDPRGFLGALANPVREGPYPRGGFRLASGFGSAEGFFAWNGNSNAGLDSAGFTLDASPFFSLRRSSRAFLLGLEVLLLASLSRSTLALSASTYSLEVRLVPCPRFASSVWSPSVWPPRFWPPSAAKCASVWPPRVRPPPPPRVVAARAHRGGGARFPIPLAPLLLAPLAPLLAPLTSHRLGAALGGRLGEPPRLRSLLRRVPLVPLPLLILASRRVPSSEACTGEPAGGVGGGGVEPLRGRLRDSRLRRVPDPVAGSPPSAAGSPRGGVVRRLGWFSISSPAFAAIPVISASTHTLVRRRSSLDSLSAALEAAAASRKPPAVAPAVLTKAPTTPPNPRTALTPRLRMSSWTSSRDSGRDEASSVGDDDDGSGGDGDEDSAVVAVVPSDADSTTRHRPRVMSGSFAGLTGSPVSSAPSSRESPRGASPPGRPHRRCARRRRRARSHRPRRKVPSKVREVARPRRRRRRALARSRPASAA